MNNSNSYSRKSMTPETVKVEDRAMYSHRNRKDKCLPLLISLTMVVLAFLAPMPAPAATFIETASESFGTFGAVEYIRYTGRFVGTTALGDYRMAFEIVAPADPALGNGTVLIEPPHFFFGPLGRDGVLGRAFVFGHGFSYATVGYATDGLSILDPEATDLVLAGQPVGDLGPDRVWDFDILVQFVQALTSDPFAELALGAIERKAGYGISASADAWQVVFHRGGQGLLDFTLLDRNLWQFPAAPPEILEILPEEFTPLTGIGKVLWVESEGDLLISAATQLRRSVVGPNADPDNYRLYEIAGAPHFPLDPPLNPLDFSGVVRAMLLAGDQWVRAGTPPPPSVLLAAAPPGAIDPVYCIRDRHRPRRQIERLGRHPVPRRGSRPRVVYRQFAGFRDPSGFTRARRGLVRSAMRSSGRRVTAVREPWRLRRARRPPG